LSKSATAKISIQTYPEYIFYFLRYNVETTCLYGELKALRWSKVTSGIEVRFQVKAPVTPCPPTDPETNGILSRFIILLN
jgi:hypothetical protein